MTTELTVSSDNNAIESALIVGDLSKLTVEQRLAYYNNVCKSLGLNPLTKPFEYIILNGKMTLYARRDATDQLRKRDGVSIDKIDSEVVDDLYVVKAYASTADGRKDASTGVVSILNLKGEAKANALMKGETKAKRRVTLSICGLGWLDETEVETIPNSREVYNVASAEVRDESPTDKPDLTQTQATQFRKLTNWAGKEVPADEPLGKAAATAKFETLFVSKFNHSNHFLAHIKKHFGVETASALTWDMAIALHNHLYKKEDDVRFYRPEPTDKSSGWDAFRSFKQPFIDKGLEPLYNELTTYVDTRLGSLDGTLVKKTMGNILEAVGIAFDNPPNPTDLQEIKDAIDKDFGR